MCFSYEPELFPGLIYRMIKPRIVLLIFVSGKVVLTGKDSESLVLEKRLSLHHLNNLLKRNVLFLQNWHFFKSLTHYFSKVPKWEEKSMKPLKTSIPSSKAFARQRRICSIILFSTPGCSTQTHWPVKVECWKGLFYREMHSLFLILTFFE